MLLFRICLLVVVSGCVLGSAFASGPLRTEHGTIELVSETSGVKPGSPFTLAIRLQPDPDWATQWRSCSIEWTLPEGFVAGPIRESTPDAKYSDYSSTPQTYGYGGEVFLLVEITPPATLETGTTVELTGKASWALWKKRETGVMAEMDLGIILPVDSIPEKETEWAEAIGKARAGLPAPSADLTVTGYREDKQITLVVDATRDLNPEASNFYFYEDRGQLETGLDYTAWRSSRQARIEVREFDRGSNPDRLSGLLQAQGGWFHHGAENIDVEFALVDHAPPPPQPLGTLASAVLRSLGGTQDYRKLRDFYARRKEEIGEEWVDSVYARRLLATLNRLQTEAASATVVDLVHPESPDVNFTGADGRLTRLSSIVPRLVETDEFYLQGCGNIVCRFILEQAQRDGVLLLPPLPSAARDLLNQGISAAHNQDFPAAVKAFEAALGIPYSPYESGRNPRTPEIYFNLGLAESQLPGHELRAIAWFGVYLTANPYAPAPNEAAVLQQIDVLLEQNRANLAAWLRLVQEAAGTNSNGYYRFQTVLLWADAGEIQAAQKAAALIPVADHEYCISLPPIIKAQLQAGDISGAQQTVVLIKDRYPRAVVASTANTTYAGERTEVAYTLTNAQVDIAEALILAGRIGEAKMTLADARQSATRIRYATYESLVQPRIATALFRAGELDEARAVLALARKVVDSNPEPNAIVRELLGIALAQLLTGDTVGARATFAFAQGVAGSANFQDFARQMAVAQAEGGDIAGAQTTIGLITDNSDLDTARLAIVQAQVKRGDRDGAETTAFLIKGVYDKSRARLARVSAAARRGSTPTDWLDVLDEGDSIQDCPLNDAIFTDLPGYLKARAKSENPSDIFESLRGISSTQIRARNAIRQMAGVLANP